jgi:hypothetical protein
MANLPNIDYTSRDFTAIQQSLTDHIKTYFPNDWSDFTASNLGMALMDLVAYVGDQLHFYLDSQANECYLPTVRQRRNSLSLAALVGYVPRTVAAASAPIQMTLDVAQANETQISAYTTFNDTNGNVWEFLENIAIPAGRIDTNSIAVSAEVLGTGDGTTDTFSFNTTYTNLTAGSASLAVTISGTTYTIAIRTDGNMSLPMGGSGLLDNDTGLMYLYFSSTAVPDNATNILISYTYDQDIVSYQGQTKLAQFVSDGTNNQEYTISQTPVLFTPLVDPDPVLVDPNRFEVWVGDPAAPFGNSTGTMWTRVDALVTSAAADQVYQLKLNEQDQVVVMFGDDANGAIPPSGATMNIIYRSGGGLKGNIAIGGIDGTVTGVAGLLAITVNVTNTDRGSGGAERESLDEIRVNVPAFARTNDTATTESDFDDLSSSFSRSGSGAIVRAKSRLEPPLTVNTKTVHSSYLLTTVPGTTPALYYLLLPAAPAVVSTIRVYYQVGGVPVTVTATDLGSGTANLTGHASLNSGTTRLRYDRQDVTIDSPAGFVGNGAIMAFGPASLTYGPIYPNSVQVHYEIAGVHYVAYDDGAGNLVGTRITSGTINYVTRSVSITFNAPPNNGQAITFDYQTCLYMAFNTPPDAGSNITIDMESGPTVKYFPTNNIQVYTWSLDGAGALTEPGETLRDQLKAYLDLRRVMCTSVEVLSGFMVKVHFWLTVTYTSSVSQSETNTRIVAAINDYFNSVVEVAPGVDLALAGIYDVLYPLYGVEKVIIQDVGLRVPVATGDGVQSVFKDDALLPGEHISTGKLPMVAGTGEINVYVDDTLVGSSSAGTPVATFSGSGVLTGSFVNITTGDFEIKSNSAPSRLSKVWLDYFLDGTTALGMDVWNVSIEPWEVGIVGDIYVNSVKIN